MQNAQQIEHRRFRILNITLPKADEHSKEIVPVLVDERTGLPPRLALRWVMRSRRLAVSENTLGSDLRAASLLYSFCEDELGTALDDLFADGYKLTSVELDRLIEYLRSGAGGMRSIRALSTTGQYIANIERFLRWLAKPMDRGGTVYVAAQDLVLYHDQLTLTFSGIRSFRSRGQRIEPLSLEEQNRLDEVVGPIKRTDGHYDFPLRFQISNPWKPQSRLRNWIACRISRDLGLRRGELGKIRIDDLRLVRGHAALAVRRRPLDPADTRTSGNRPRVKTVERELPLSELLASAIRQYQHTQLRDGGRKGARSPYLLVAANGSAISGSSLDAVWNAVTARVERKLSWHVLRHTWAEELADGLLREYEGHLDSHDVVMGILRELGGWTPTSSTPFHYISNAMRTRGNDYLRRRNARFDVAPPT